MVDNYCGEMVLRYIKTNPGPAPMMNTSYKLVEYLKHTLDQDEIILVHNHPSGMLVPSDSDKDITAKVKEGGKILGIPLSDHIIINAEFNYYSFADNGIL